MYQPGRRGTARVGILTILPVEFDAMRLALHAKHEIIGSGYYTPDVKTLDVVLKKSDRGNLQAGIDATNLIEDYRPEVVLLVGIAGGLDGRDDVAPGDVVVPDYLHYAALRSLKGSGAHPRHIPHDPPTVSLHEECVFPASRDSSWSASIPVDPPTERTARVIVKPLIAGEKVYGNASHPEQRRLLESDEFSDAVAVDMESMGVASAIHRARRSLTYNPRLLVVRGISDPVEREAADRTEGTQMDPNVGDPNEVREQWRPYAAAAAAAFAAVVVARILNTPDERPFARSGTAGLARGRGAWSWWGLKR